MTSLNKHKKENSIDKDSLKNEKFRLTCRDSNNAKLDKKNFQLSNKLLIILTIISLIALIFVINGIGKFHLNSFTTKIQTELPVDMAFNEKSGVIADSLNNRLLILNEEKNITNIISSNEPDSKLDNFNKVSIYQDEIYVCGCCFYNDGCYISSEKILKFKKNDYSFEEVYCSEYSEEEAIACPLIKSFTVNSDGIYITKIYKNKIDLVLNSDCDDKIIASYECQNLLYNASYSYNFNRLFFVDYSKNCYLLTVSDGNVMIIDGYEFSKSVFGKNIVDDLGFTRSCNFGLTTVNWSYSENGSVESVTFLDHSKNIYRSLNNGSVVDIPSEFDISIDNVIYELFYWLSVLWFILLSLAIILWLMIFKLKIKGKIFVGCLVLLFFVCLYYSYAYATMTINDSEVQLRTQSKQISYLLSKDFVPSDGENNTRFTEIIQNANEDNYGSNNYKNFQEILGDLCVVNGVNSGIYSVVYSVSGDNIIKVFADSRGLLLPGFNFTNLLNNSGIMENGKVDTIDDTQAVEIKTDSYKQLGVYSKVYDKSKNVVAIVGTCTYLDNVINNAIVTCLHLLINLAAIIITLFVVVISGKGIKDDIHAYIALKKENNKDKAVMLNGCYQIVFKLMSMMDMALQVYVAQSLCIQAAPEQIAGLVAIPSTGFYIGMWIGSVACPILFRKLSFKTCGIIGSAGCILAYAAMIISVGASSLALYSVAKAFQGLFAQGILFMLGDNIALLTKDKKLQNKAIMSSQSAALASTVVATLLGGYLGQYLSYIALYAVITCLAIIMLLLCLIIFDSDFGKLNNTSTSGSSIRRIWSMFIKPSLLIYFICFLFPKSLLTGYSSYLFPLFTSGAGISAVLLSNINVFSTTFNYFTNDPINRFCDNKKNTASMCVLILSAGITLVCFIFCPTIWWAIVVLFVVGTVVQVLAVRGKKYIANYAEESSEDPALVQTDSNLVSSFLLTLNSPILAGLVTLGLEIGCALCGAICSTGGMLFGLYNKRNKK